LAKRVAVKKPAAKKAVVKKPAAKKSSAKSSVSRIEMIRELRKDAERLSDSADRLLDRALAL